MGSVNPRTPIPPSGGYVVLNSDDGRIWDYDFFKTIKQTASENNQWYPYQGSAFCPAVNPGYINDYTRRGYRCMTTEHLREIVNGGGEIVSHSRHHLVLDWINVGKPVTAGDTTIQHTFNDIRATKDGYSFTIEEGATVETFTVKKVIDANNIEITAPLTNNFTTAARIHITKESATDLLQGAIDDFAAMGITVRHHVDPWARHSERAHPWLQEIFDSVVEMSLHNGVPHRMEDIDLHRIKRSEELHTLTPVKIDAILNDTVEKQTVLFVMFHAWGGDVYTDKLALFVNKCYEKGIRMITHSEAVAMIKEKQGIK